ncbi:MAG: FIG004453: protein YceG like [uncultured Sulfurovum sp.]|uniref:Endolytic murein transglycosylase n=1 Tax=uncultured Sulfurovum sp. TaxID=269237 RepID=A0A6S6SN18_9BACT|nr:MAG: FIG004453: protein YceG like [uncultured Sulfurovum sp.]
MNSKKINVFRNIEWSTCIEHCAVILIMSLAFYSILPVQTEKKISISKGIKETDIIAHLNQRGPYSLHAIDRFILARFGKIKEGEVKFKQTTQNRIDFLYALTQAKIPLLKITLIPGETLEIFFKQVADKLDINESKIMDAYKNLAVYPEASIVADTYFVPRKMNETKLMKFLLRGSERTYKKLATKYYGDYNTTEWKIILTIASIIQKEAASKAEMPLISSVIYNRLEKNMRLQMDGTLNYGKYSHIKVTPERIRNDYSTFNTYKHKGLPESPIGSVSMHAIDAAINPKKTNYLYFMRNSQGVHDFTDTFKKHRQNIKKLK